MKGRKWDIVPKTLQKIREWAWCKSPEDLADRIVYRFRNSDGKKLGKRFSDEEHRKNSQRDKEKNYTDWVKWIKDFEQGKDRPTFSQLQKIAAACHRHHAFFMAPAEKIILPDKPVDFRQNPGVKIDNKKSCHPFIFDAIAKYQWVKAQFRKNNPGHRASFLVFSRTEAFLDERLPLVKRAKLLVEKMQGDLGLDFDAWRKKSKPKQLEELKKAIDRKNILVFTTNGSPNHRFSLDELKGFAMYDEAIPLVALNNGEFDNERQREKIFTLVHELAHLYIFKNQNVASGGMPSGEEWTKAKRADEHFCNMVAEEFILPKRDFEKNIPIDLDTSSDDLAGKLKELAYQQKISKWVLLYRCLHLGKLNKSGELSSDGKMDRRAYKIFSDVRDKYFEEMREYRRKKRDDQEKSRENSDKANIKKGGGQTEKHDTAKRIVDVNSRLFCQVALGSYLTSELDHKTLTELLNIRNFSDVGELQERTSNWT